MANTHSQGAFGRLLMAPGLAPHNFNATPTAKGVAIEFLSETISERQRIIGGRGIRGTLSNASERARTSTSVFAGEISMYVSSNDIHTFCSTEANGGLGLFGMDEPDVTDTFELDDTALGYIGILIDTDYGTWEYQDCKLDYWQMRSRAPTPGRSGEPDMVYLTLGIQCSSLVKDTAWPSTTVPAIGTAANDSPYVFADSSESTGITIAGTERAVEEFVIRVDHRLKAKYTNSLTPHSLRATDRIVRAMFRVPWNTTNDDLFGLSNVGVQANLKLSNGGAGLPYSTHIQMPGLQVPQESPVIPGKGQVSLIVQGVARSKGASKELTIVNDHNA